MTTNKLLENYGELRNEYKIPVGEKEVSAWLSENNVGEEGQEVISSFISYVVSQEKENRINKLSRQSRIPQSKDFSFENFNVSTLKKNEQEKISMIKTLSFLYANRNLAFLGPAGTGKTHLALAIGRECLKKGLRTYFLKMIELKAKFNTAITRGFENRCISSFMKYDCLIIDEIGYCKFNKEETRMFFHLIDRFGMKKTGSIIFTSNKDFPQWQELFDEDDALECAIDRLSDRALCVAFSGSSYRGKGKECITLNFGDLR